MTQPTPAARPQNEITVDPDLVIARLRQLLDEANERQAKFGALCDSLLEEKRDLQRQVLALQGGHDVADGPAVDDVVQG